MSADIANTVVVIATTICNGIAGALNYYLNHQTNNRQGNEPPAHAQPVTLAPKQLQLTHEIISDLNGKCRQLQQDLVIVTAQNRRLNVVVGTLICTNTLAITSLFWRYCREV